MFDLAAVLVMLAHPTEGLSTDQLAAGLQDLARLQAALSACRARFVGAFERSGGPRRDGATDTAAWLRDHTRISGREAAEQVQVARVVDALPGIGEALAGGGITPGHAATIARVVHRTPTVAGRGEDLLAAAQGAGVDEFTRAARGIELAEISSWTAQRARERRRVTERLDDDGTGVLTAVLPVEAHVEVIGVLDAIAEELWAADHPNGDPGALGARAATLAQRRADALVEMARRARTVAPGAGRRDRSRVHVLIDVDVLAGRVGGHGLLDDGTPIPAATARRLACGARLLPWVLGGASVPLDHGRSRRYATDTQIDALIVRDGGCVFPGCTRPWHWCDAHHLLEWNHDGPTNLENLALVCENHHHLIHEAHWTLTRELDGTWHATSPNGHIHHTRPPHTNPTTRAGPTAA
jgi:hypothetical protein